MPPLQSFVGNGQTVVTPGCDEISLSTTSTLVATHKTRSRSKLGRMAWTVNRAFGASPHAGQVEKGEDEGNSVGRLRRITLMPGRLSRLRASRPAGSSTDVESESKRISRRASWSGTVRRGSSWLRRFVSAQVDFAPEVQRGGEPEANHHKPEVERVARL